MDDRGSTVRETPASGAPIQLTETALSGAAFDRPPSAVRAKVFLCAAPRTGSWLLSRAMIHGGLGIPHEYFNAKHIGVIGPRLGIKSLASGVRLGEDAAARRAYAKAVVAARTVNGVFAAKIHWGQYASYLDNAEGDELLGDGCYIHLYREDLLAQAISFHISRLTGRWGSDTTPETPPADSPSFFDDALIEQSLKDMAQAESNWRLFFASNGIDPLRISYERLTSDLPGVVRAIAVRFGLEPPADASDYVEESGDGARDAGVPPRSKIRTAFVRVRRRVTPAGEPGRASESATPAAVEAAPPPGVIRIDAPTVRSNRRQSICLCMIVKNEAKVIERCLKSVRPLIDYWIIADTGSTDGTQDVITRYLSDIPGELHQRPWVDFAHNRSETLALARSRNDYSLIIDADDQLEFAPGFRAPFLKADSYAFEIHNKQLSYWRPQLVKNALNWRYEGVLHEFLSCDPHGDGKRVLSEDRTQVRLPGVKLIMSDEGARRTRSAATYMEDAKTLERAVLTEKDPFLACRYRFYLAQSHMNAGASEKALENYLERATLGFWAQEVFISLYRAAKLKAELGHNDDDVLEAFRAAERVDPKRAEASHAAARFCREHERFAEGYEFARRALSLKPSAEGLFVEAWIYDYGLLDEYAVNAYWAGHYEESLKACERLLATSRLASQADRKRFEANAAFARDKLGERKQA